MYRGEGHLTDEDAIRFVNGEMNDAEFDEADFHQADCSDCGALVDAKGELHLAEQKAAAAEQDPQIGPEDIIWPED